MGIFLNLMVKLGILLFLSIYTFSEEKRSIFVFDAKKWDEVREDVKLGKEEK